MSLRWTIGTFVGLLVLTALTFGLSEVALGRLEVPIVLGIGAFKALLVAAVFMELAVDRFGNRAALASAVILALCLVIFATADVLTRTP